MEITNSLYNYGIGGIFIAYLIYDRQVIIKKLMDTLNKLNTTIRELDEKWQRQAS